MSHKIKQFVNGKSERNVSGTKLYGIFDKQIIFRKYLFITQQ